MYHAEFGRCPSKGVGLNINGGNPKKLRSAGPPSHWDGARLTLKTSPSPCVLPRQIWSFCVKGCTNKQKGTPKTGSAGLRPLHWERGMRGYSWNWNQRLGSGKLKWWSYLVEEEVWRYFFSVWPCFTERWPCTSWTVTRTRCHFLQSAISFSWQTEWSSRRDI